MDMQTAWAQDPRSEDQIVADIQAATTAEEIRAAIPGDAAAKAEWTAAAGSPEQLAATGWQVTKPVDDEKAAALDELGASEYVGEGIDLLWEIVLQAAPTEAIYGHKDQPERNGWLYNLVNEMKTDRGMMLWEQLCAELDRREA
jgi:hypothetical protein